jgi:hypothetical protein
MVVTRLQSKGLPLRTVKVAVAVAVPQARYQDLPPLVMAMVVVAEPVA